MDRVHFANRIEYGLVDSYTIPLTSFPLGPAAVRPQGQVG